VDRYFETNHRATAIARANRDAQNNPTTRYSVVWNPYGDKAFMVIPNDGTRYYIVHPGERDIYVTR
jgi:hypothetical protein